MTTWIIVCCVAVFVADRFMTVSPVLMRTVAAEGVDLKGIDQSQLIQSNPQQLGAYIRVILSDPQTGEPVAVKEYELMRPLKRYLHFSTERGFLQFQFWRLIGFQFLHANLSHLFFNMLGLFFFGPMVEQYLGSKRYLAFYLLSGIFGACMYLLLNLGGLVVTEIVGHSVSIPGLLVNDPTVPLVGASAGVFGVLMAGAFLSPNAVVYLFLILPMKLRTLAYALVVIALYTLITGGNNAGGEAGHLGGAMAGFYFIRHPQHLHNFFDFLGKIDPTSHHYRGKRSGIKSKAVSKMRGGQSRSGPSRREVDRILDKVHNEGLASLTEKEKRVLSDASKDGR